MQTVNNTLVKQSEKKTFSTFITQPSVQSKVKHIIGKNADNFITSIVSAVSANPTLSECTNDSIFSAALLGAGLKLAPSPQLGHFYMVPFENKKKSVKEAQFQLGYKGYIQLAIRSGDYKDINVLAIKEGELIYYNPLSNKYEINLIEDEELRDKTPTSHYYGMFELMNGFTKIIIWPRKKMELHADKYSAAFNLDYYRKLQNGEKVLDKYGKDITWKLSSFWYKDFDAMGLKTMIRHLLSKWGILSIDMQKAFEEDIKAEIKENEENDSWISNAEVPEMEKITKASVSDDPFDI